MKYFPSHASQGRAWYIRKCSLAWLPKIRFTDGLVQGCSISVANALLKDTAVLHWTIDIRFRRKHCPNALAQMAVLHAPDHWAVGYPSIVLPAWDGLALLTSGLNEMVDIFFHITLFTCIHCHEWQFHNCEKENWGNEFQSFGWTRSQHWLR